MGDTGTGAPQQFQVAKAINSHCQQTNTCLAVFILGDVIYENGIKSATDPQLQTKFEKPYADINLPFYIMYGNHDYLDCRDCYLKYQSPKWHFPARYYRKDFDNVSFFIIDTEKFDANQQTWLNNELQNNHNKFKIVLGHRPLETEEATKFGENWTGKKELKNIICNSADAYITGHSHILEDQGHIENCKVTQLISGAGGSYVRTIHQPFTGVFHSETNGFLTLTVTETKATYTSITKLAKTSIPTPLVDD
jgi:predicted phosphodiesterase